MTSISTQMNIETKISTTYTLSQLILIKTLMDKNSKVFVIPSDDYETYEITNGWKFF